MNRSDRQRIYKWNVLVGRPVTTDVTREAYTWQNVTILCLESVSVFAACSCAHSFLLSCLLGLPGSSPRDADTNESPLNFERLVAIFNFRIENGYRRLVRRPPRFRYADANGGEVYAAIIHRAVWFCARCATH